MGGAKVVMSPVMLDLLAMPSSTVLMVFLTQALFQDIIMVRSISSIAHL